MRRQYDILPGDRLSQSGILCLVSRASAKKANLKQSKGKSPK
jgi:hypothetical protein